MNCTHGVFPINMDVAEVHDLKRRFSGRRGGLSRRSRSRRGKRQCILIDRRRLAQTKRPLTQLRRCLSEGRDSAQGMAEDRSLLAYGADADVWVFEL